MTLPAEPDDKRRPLLRGKFEDTAAAFAELADVVDYASRRLEALEAAVAWRDALIDRLSGRAGLEGTPAGVTPPGGAGEGGGEGGGDGAGNDAGGSPPVPGASCPHRGSFDVTFGGGVVELRVKKTEAWAKLPAKAGPREAGLDLAAAWPCVVAPGRVTRVPLGIAVAIPDGYCGVILDRSGLASHGFRSLGGVIDATYRGELAVLATSVGDSFAFAAGDRVAQLLVLPVPNVDVVEVSDLDATERGDRGFGSTDRCPLEVP